MGNKPEIERLRESEERYRFIAETIPQIVWSARADGWIDYDNQRWYDFTGLSAERGAGWGWETVIHPDDLPRVDMRWKTALTTGVGYDIEYRLRRYDGVYRWQLDRAIPMNGPDGRVIRWFGTATDIEDQKRIEDALRQSEKRLALLNTNLEKEVIARTEELRKKEVELFQTQKLEAIGRLAGGVAHDFNNLLTGIQGVTESLKEGLAPGDPRSEEIELMTKSVQRAFGLTRQLLAFGGRQVTQHRVLDLHQIVMDTQQLLARLIGEHIEIELSLNATAPMDADRSQMEQILMNLTLNARDAMPNGGKILIRTQTLQLPDPSPDFAFHVPAGTYVFLEVRDTGVGMAPETISHVFEPFFTTKAEFGTGLGLSTVYGIIKRSNGDIRVDSVLGKGSSFKIVIPTTTAKPIKSLSRPENDTAEGRQETVLVVEDEELVRKTVSRKLEKHGYRVLAVGSGAEALQTAKSQLASIQLVLSDVVMPEMDGHELVNALQEQKPGLPAIYMSGYPREIIGPDIQFIDKTLLATELLPKVREALDHA